MELHGGAAPLVVDQVDVEARVQALGAGRRTGPARCWVRTTATRGRRSASASGMAGPAATSGRWSSLPQPSRHRYYRIVFDNPRAITWHVGEVRFRHAGRPVRVGGPHQFSSAWMSAGRGEEWVYVDLGAPCTFDRVVLRWLARPAEAVLQVSDDAATWRTLQPLAASPGNDDDVRLTTPARGRYVRVLMQKAVSARRLRADRDGGVRPRRSRAGRQAAGPRQRRRPARARGRALAPPARLAGEGRWCRARHRRLRRRRVGDRDRARHRAQQLLQRRARCRTPTSATTR